MGLQAFFEPRGVALVGASSKEGRPGYVFMRNLLDGFPGPVYPVNPKETEVFGRPAYATVEQVPDPVDLAVVVVPAPEVPPVLEACGRRGVRAALVISGGFAEVGEEGQRLQDQIVAVARRWGVRIVGPNCFGIVSVPAALNASMALGSSLPQGRISLLTQSGAYGMAILQLGQEEQLGFARVVAHGNKADVDDHELLSYLGQDDRTHVICAYLESIPRGRAFYEVARQVTPEKPVVVMKAGRGRAGRRAAFSHTASLSGENTACDAAFRQAGVVVVRSGRELLDVAKALDWQPWPRGPRCAIITNSGGVGVELSDALEEAGLEVAELSSGFQSRIREILPPLGTPRNPIDITTAWARFPVLYPELVRLLLDSPEVDIVVPVLLQRSALMPEVAAGVRDAVARAREAGNDKPVYVCWVAPEGARPNRVLLEQSGIPCFPWPPRTAAAVAAAWSYSRNRFRILGRSKEPPGRGHAPGAPAGIRAGDGADPARDLLARYGIPAVETRLCRSGPEAARAASELGLPVVLKVRSPDVTHKSDVGGVRVGLASPEAVESGYAEIIRSVRERCPGARVDGVQVQPLLRGPEVVVGGYRDPQFGPLVMFGLGGVFVEVLRDVTFRLAPLTHREALEMIGEIRGFPVLQGARGGVTVDLDALARLVVAAADLLASEPVLELDLNPVVCTAHGPVAVDWRLRVEGSSAPGGQAEPSPA